MLKKNQQTSEPRRLEVRYMAMRFVHMVHVDARRNTSGLPGTFGLRICFKPASMCLGRMSYSFRSRSTCVTGALNMP